MNTSIYFYETLQQQIITSSHSVLVVMQCTIYVQKLYTTGYIPYISQESLHEFESISFTRNNYLAVQVLPQMEFRCCVAAATSWVKVVGSWVVL